MEIGPISKVMNILTIKKRYSSDPPQLVMVVRFPCVGDLAEPTVVIMFQRSQHLEKLDLLQRNWLAMGPVPVRGPARTEKY